MHEKLIMVTGAGGLVGSRLVSRLERAFAVADFEADDLDEIRERFGSRITALVHLAAELPISDVLRELSGFSIEQLVFGGSIMSMKPARDDEVITEESPLANAAGEQRIADARGAIPAVILRFAELYDEEGHSTPIAQQIRRIYERRLESYVFAGNKDHRQPFVHAADAAEAIVKAIERRHALDDWEVFLIAEPEPVSYGMLQDRIGNLLEGHGWPTVRIPSFAAKLALLVLPVDAHYPVLVDKARLKLSWTPKKRLWTVLPSIIVGLSMDPRRWYRANQLGDAPQR